VTYAAEQLLEEVAYLGRHLHWSLDEILDLEHSLRQDFVRIAGDFAAGEE
jgi:hypothetical protein